MAAVLSLLKPYAAYELIDPNETGDPYFTLCLTRPKGCSHAIVRRLIYEFSFQHDEAKGQYIRIRHESGNYFLYGFNLSPVWERLDNIHDLIIFDPTYHQPVTDSSAPIFTRMEVPEARQRLAQHLA
jgi:hypothetical protein